MQSDEKPPVPPGWSSGAKGKMGISGMLQFRDKDGNIVKEVEIKGSVPLKGVEDGTDDQ